METSLKHRIVGIVVLVVIVVVCMPLLLDHSHDADSVTKNTTAQVKIHLPESLRQSTSGTVVGLQQEDVADIPSPSTTAEVDAGKSQGAKVVIATAPAVQQSSAKVMTTSHDDSDSIKADAWVIQLASFKQQANAKRLVEQLRASGYQAYFRQQKYSGGAMVVRVFVGPMVDRSKVDPMLKQLMDQFQLQGIPVQYKT